MTASRPVVRIRDAAIGHGRTPVVRHLDLTVHEGEFWIVLGPNGAGKSTFLQALLGVAPVLGGGVWIDRDRVPRERIGFVPQRCDVAPTVPTTVREFVLLGTVGIRTTRRERRERLDWALAHSGLTGFARRDLATLSGGERQRVLVARALVRTPRLLLLDEPTTHLDSEAERGLVTLLARLNREDGLTTVMVTHEVTLLASIASHVAVFRDGTVRAGDRRTMLPVPDEGARA